MKKSVWIFLFAVLLPSVVLGWLALRSAEEQQIVFERRTAELYQKETESLAATVRDTVGAERRVFGETVRHLLAKGDANALARDFTDALAAAWPVNAVGFAINADGKLVSPSVAMASKEPELKRFLTGNSSFLTSTEPALVYNWAGDSPARGKLAFSQTKQPANVSLTGSPVSKSAGLALQNPDVSKRPAAPGSSLEQGKGKAASVSASQSRNMQQADAVHLQFGAGRTDSGSSAPWKAALPAPAPPSASAPTGTAGPAAQAAAAAKPAKPDGTPMPGAAPPAPEKDSLREAAGRPVEGELAKTTNTRVPASPLEEKAAADKATSYATHKTFSLESAEMPAMKMGAGEAEEIHRAPRPAPVPQEQNPRPQAVDESRARAKAISRVNTVGQAIATANSGGSLLPSISTPAQNRLVEPQQLLGQQSAALSAIVPETAEFRSLTEDSEDGMVARFVQDRLNLIFWLRPPEAPEMVFGCLVEAGHFSDAWKDVLETRRSSSPGHAPRDSQPEFVLALLDDRGKPVATHPAAAAARDWKHPFVASEIGEMLPHWEAALYLASPTALAESARGLWRTLAFTIAGAVALIAFGGWLVVADARRQLALAQQKTDFVSNVSHELKTPLTSIRMFAELMHDRPQPPEKQSQYLRIITVEAERLTRLINNVLDFAKIGRRQKRLEMKPLDLHRLVGRVWESHELHLREAGFTTRWEAAPGSYPVLGDDDALAQVLVNLLSNAEKYSTTRKEIELHTWLDDGHVEIAVLDRGIGVPGGDERKIFEAFYRAHDSLNSGIQGSGLGLTLAQRIAHEHGAEIRFERREGGGCRFTLRVPLAGKVEN